MAPMDRPTPSWPTARTNAGFRGEVVLPVNEVVWSSKPWTIWRLLGHEAVKHDNKFRRPLSQLLCHAFFSEEEQQVRSTTLRASCSMVQQPEQATTGERMVDMMPRWSLVHYPLC
ncbi:hypothetical protein ACQJBY_052318 [Aegilops geniculata]